MSACSGNPKDCSFCGESQVDCAKSEVAGCLANPTAECTVCKGNGCVAKSCTGDIKTCPTCMGNFASCRKAEFSAASGPAEGIERAVKPADA